MLRLHLNYLLVVSFLQILNNSTVLFILLADQFVHLILKSIQLHLILLRDLQEILFMLKLDLLSLLNKLMAFFRMLIKRGLEF